MATGSKVHVEDIAAAQGLLKKVNDATANINGIVSKIEAEKNEMGSYFKDERYKEISSWIDNVSEGMKSATACMTEISNKLNEKVASLKP